MSNRDMMTDHQEQQACKDDTHHSQAIPQDQLNKCRMRDYVEGIAKQFENQTQQTKDTPTMNN